MSRATRSSRTRFHTPRSLPGRVPGPSLPESPPRQLLRPLASRPRAAATSDEWWALEIKANPVAARFQYAPLPEEEKMREVFDACCVTNEHARVPIPTYKSGSSRFNMDDDSGCERHGVEATPRPKCAKSGKRMACSYSPSPRMNEKWSNETVKIDALVRMVDLFGAREKIKGNSGEDTTRLET
ncbi:hypothetical protein D1007_25297 [Hordeum vulgare]|nr:hypothetical protein D1007_25297 [Hordeum vulgare]